MITLTIPSWLLILLMSLFIINSVLQIASLWVKRKIKKIKIENFIIDRNSQFFTDITNTANGAERIELLRKCEYDHPAVGMVLRAYEEKMKK